MKRVLLMLLLALVVPLATKAEVIEIGNGDWFTDSPFHEWYNASWDEEIYPMEALPYPCVINSISYNNFGAGAMGEWSVGNVATYLKIYMGERASATFASTTDWTPLGDLTLVYSHENVPIGVECGLEEFVLDAPFYYGRSGNLVVVVVTGFENANWDANYRLSTTYEMENLNVTLHRPYYHNEVIEYPDGPGELWPFSVDIQLNVDPVIIACPKPNDLVLESVTAHSASFTWTSDESVGIWDVCITDGEIPDEEIIPTATGLTTSSYTFTNLIPSTNYTVFVRSNCGDGNVSTWASLSFLTSFDFGGNGTLETPYLLYEKADLEALTTAIANGFPTDGRYFMLMNDIDDVTQPIGGAFRGDFNGNGHTITMNLVGSGNLALFSQLGHGAAIHDLTVDGSVNCTAGSAAGIAAYVDWYLTINIWDCTNRASVSCGSDYVAGILAQGKGYGNITNCTNIGSITGADSFVGGILGWSHFVNVIDCVNRGAVTCYGASCGGIAGSNSNRIINCCNKGTIACPSYGGGIVGYGNSQIRNCYNVGSLSFGSNSGGIAGGSYGGSVENCYNGGTMIADNTTNCGAIAGGVNSGHYNYYKEGVFPVAYGTAYSDNNYSNSTSFIQSGTSNMCTLAEPILGTTDLRTALNNWRADHNDNDYTEWLTDTYGNNNYMPTFNPGMPPGLDVSPNPLVMAPRPIGAWMPGEMVTLANTSQEDLLVKAIGFTESSLIIDESMSDVNLPFTLFAEQSRNIYVGTNSLTTVSPGAQSDEMVTTWGPANNELITPIELTYYTPVSPDVVELSETVSTFPQTITRSTLDLYDNYDLPGENLDAVDAVYQIVFEEEALFHAQVTQGSDAKLALYAADFNGQPGPMADNYYIGANSFGVNGQYPLSLGGDDPITNMMVEPGTYYLVLSTKSPSYILDLGLNDLPAPLPVTMVAPSTGTVDVTAPLTLQWQLGRFTSEYQLLLDTSYPPSHVLVDWTSDLAETVTVDSLPNNRIYYWSISERNAAGTTEGEVWTFTTTLNTPLELQATTPNIHVGEELLLQWSAPDRSLMGYNVYKDGEKINDTPIVATEYAVSGLAYNLEGYSFAVTAVYEEGESHPSNTVIVRVGGEGIISGTVLEQDYTTPIAGAKVTIVGYDELKVRHTYVCFTDENGVWSGAVYAGSYIVLAEKEGYQEGSGVGEVSVNYNEETEGVDLVLYEQYYPVGTVVAQYDPDSLNSQSPHVKVKWNSLKMPNHVGWHSYCEGPLYDVSAPEKVGYEYPLEVLTPYAGYRMTKVAIFSDWWGFVGGIYTCSIYVGGSQPEEGVLATSITVDVPRRLADWHECDLDTPVDVSGTEPIWVIWEPEDHNASYVAYCGNENYDWGTWCDFGEGWSHSASPYFGVWMIRQYFTNETGRSIVLGNTHEDRGFLSYNIYRTDCYNDGPYTEENTVLVASQLTDTVYIDMGWGNLESGVYKYGVSRVYGGNREGGGARSEYEANALNTRDLLSGLHAFAFNRNVDYSGTIWEDWTQLPEGWIQFDPTHPYATAALIDRDFNVCSGDYANDGYIHAFTEDNQLLTFNPSTGEIVSSVNTISHMDDCAFDFSTNTMYGVRSGVLYKIDLETGDFTLIGSLFVDIPFHMIVALACDYSGQLYGFANEYAVLYSIDKDNAQCNRISANANCGGFAPVYHASAGFDHSTGTLYLTADDYPRHLFIGTVDLNTGALTYVATFVGRMYAFCVPYGHFTTPISPVSEQVWSNCLDKDMWTSVEVNVKTNTGDSPEGTSVRFINTSEPGQGYDYIVNLDDSGYYNWDEFRKGTYNYTIEKDGYTSCGNHESIEIWEPTSLDCLLEEIALQARNLYVSPTGWAMWKEGLDGDVLHYDSDSYEGGVGLSGSPFYWAVKFTPEQLEGFDKVTSVSFYDAPGQAFNGKFMICSADDPLGHVLYQKSIATTGSGKYIDYPLEQNVEFNNEESLWIVFYFESGADYPASGSSNTGEPNGRLISVDGIQWEDIASYGINYTWKIRCHVKADGREEKQLEFYRVFLDGIFVENTSDTHFQHEVDGFVEGETHTTEVRAMYTTGGSDFATYTWTYTPCDNYAGPTTIEAEDLGDMAVLYWTLPENQISGGEWSYYDNGNFTGSIGTGGSSFYWGIMLPPDLWQGRYLGSVSVFDCAAFTGKIMIYQGGETAPGSLLYSQQYTSTGSNAFIEIPLNQLVELDESQNLWIVVNNVSSAAYPAAYTNDIGNPNSRWISLDGSDWHDITEYNLSGTWMIRAYTTDEMPVVYNILGTMVFRDGELLTETPLPRDVHSYADIMPESGYHDYSIRLVYDNLPVYQGDYYAMSCPETNAVTVGVDENESGRVSVYPNPVEDEVTVKAADMTHIRIVNALGQMVYDNELKADETRIPMGNFGSGVYVIHITTANGTFAQRVVVCGK